MLLRNLFPSVLKCVCALCPSRAIVMTTNILFLATQFSVTGHMCGKQKRKRRIYIIRNAYTNRDRF